MDEFIAFVQASFKSLWLATLWIGIPAVIFILLYYFFKV
jgi:hypothetical protein